MDNPFKQNKVCLPAFYLKKEGSKESLHFITIDPLSLNHANHIYQFKKQNIIGEVFVYNLFSLFFQIIGFQNLSANHRPKRILLRMILVSTTHARSELLVFLI